MPHDGSKRPLIRLLFLSAFVLLCAITSMCLGKFSVRINDFVVMIGGSGENQRVKAVSVVLLSVRLPRVMAALLLRAGLLVFGSAFGALLVS